MRLGKIQWFLVVLCCGLCFEALPAPIIEWNFNSQDDDADPATGSLDPSIGYGFFSFTGSTTFSFGTVGGARTSDAVTSDNSQLRVRSLPRVDADNKLAGIELTLNTIGFHDISLAWDQYNSATASRYWRVQYTLDGFDWIDHELIVRTTASSWSRHVVRFAGILEMDDRSYLGIRIVQEFESSAIGAGVEGYVAVSDGSNYSTAGSWWLDMVTVSGRSIGVENAPPSVSTVASQVLAEGTSSGQIQFFIGDDTTDPDLLDVTAVTSDSGIIPDIFPGGSGPNRSLSFTAGAPGLAVVTIRVTDEEGEFSESSFNVTVLARPVVEPGNFFVLWDLNSDFPDDDPASGSFDASRGTGVIAVTGTESYNFGSVAQGRNSDPAEFDNSMLRVRGFPTQGTAAGTCGIEARASTEGWQEIVLSWDQYNSATASRYWRVQVTTNGIDFTDGELVANTSPSVWTRQTVALHDIAGVANNPSFGFRIVSEFGPFGEYEAVSDSSNYSSAGTLWLDMIGLSGTPVDVDAEAPKLTFIRGSELRLEWPSSAPGYQLEMTEEWGTGWTPVLTPATESDGFLQVLVAPEGKARFYRLRK